MSYHPSRKHRVFRFSPNILTSFPNVRTWEGVPNNWHETTHYIKLRNQCQAGEGGFKGPLGSSPVSTGPTLAWHLAGGGFGGWSYTCLHCWFPLKWIFFPESQKMRNCFYEHFFKIFFCCGQFLSLYWICYTIASVLHLVYLAARHVGS